MTDFGKVLAALTARTTLVVAVVCFAIGIAVCRWANRPDADLKASVDSLTAAGVVQDQRTLNAIAASITLRDSLQWEREQHAKDSLLLVALKGRRIPTPQLVQDVATAPDTCRLVVAQLVDQLAIRDSIIELDSAALHRAEAAIQAWDRVAAGLAKAAIEEQALRHRAEEIARAAVNRSRTPFLELEVEPGVELPELKVSGRATALVSIGKGWQATGGYEGAIGERGTWKVGARKTLRIL